MTPLVPATVLFGDVVDSRADPGASAFLRTLRDELEAAYGTGGLAPAGFTQGDELQLLLAPGADPFARGPARRAPSRCARAPLGGRRRRRAAPGAGPRPSGPGRPSSRPASCWSGRRPGARACSRSTGDAAADALLLDLGPVLAALLAELTDRQREVARLLLIEGLRRAEAAERLGVSRATVSVIATRGRVRHLASLAAALARTFGDGVERASRAVAAQAPIGGGRGMTDDVLVLAWLVLAHLIADFVLQNDWIAINKATGGRERLGGAERPRLPRRASPSCRWCSRGAFEASCTSSWSP